ncbi:HAMP domain-containing histidine kinase [Psychroflexus sp. CAK57W]|uniref:sensor histidine kinase n=1 Tax=Psychroflexus curvus TaxID=2873595 RepID=UPI001CD023B8|nr:HAMP domain-containing sensor histidine kinase [Psychroflexus curvus]MBZ9627144.1 HAMP domain-containing histidine kinase [Psychroflexus curvus]MBZ9787148.1 HAMP domain-containing histidine kinase [Psychroflexus curvus]
MFNYRRSLRTRIFISMIALVVGASILIAGVTIYQFTEEAKELHLEKLNRKENAIRANINYVLRTTTYPVDTENLRLIFKEKIYEIQDIHNTEINIYDLDGYLLKSSFATFYMDSVQTRMAPEKVEILENSADKKYIENFKINDQNYQSSYTYILDNYFKPIGILNLPYIEDDGFLQKELRDFLILLSQVYLFMLIAAIVLAYFLSKYITSSLQTISKKITKTRFDQANPKISYREISYEIKPLVKAYNEMIDELEESAVKLARNEREEAWRQMARQVAHEIKNPLTPMRLSMQSFERSFDPDDPNIHSRVKEFSKTIIQQIDNLSAIAGAFSDFAKMPAQQKESLNAVEIIKLALDIFNDNKIQFYPEKDNIQIKFDRSQLIRIITNLVKNAIQATEHLNNPVISVSVLTEGDEVIIKVEDNGAGIPKDMQERIFEPRFTTKTSGMGLGLGMVKNIVETYKGDIKLTSKPEEGTIFTLKFPKTNTHDI